MFWKGNNFLFHVSWFLGRFQNFDFSRWYAYSVCFQPYLTKLLLEKKSKISKCSKKQVRDRGKEKKVYNNKKTVVSISRTTVGSGLHIPDLLESSRSRWTALPANSRSSSTGVSTPTKICQIRYFEFWSFLKPHQNKRSDVRVKSTFTLLYFVRSMAGNWGANRGVDLDPTPNAGNKGSKENFMENLHIA